MLRACLGKREDSGIERDRGEHTLVGGLRRLGLPVQAAGDHQVQREPEVALDSDRDPLTDAADILHAAPFDGRRRWRGGAQEEGSTNRDALETMTGDTVPQGLDIN